MVIYSVIHKRVFTPLRDLPTRIIEAIDHSSNSTMAFAFTKNPRIFCKCKCHCWVWRMVDSLYYSSRKISERCENSFLNYRINYQKLCYLMRQITKDLNWPSGCLDKSGERPHGLKLKFPYVIWWRSHTIFNTEWRNSTDLCTTWGALGWLKARCLIVHVLRGSSIVYLATLVPVGPMHRLYMYFPPPQKNQ